MLGPDFLLKEEWMSPRVRKALKRVGPILAIAIAGSALSLFAAGPRLASADDPHGASADNSHGANANAHDNNSPNSNIGGNPSNNGVGNGGTVASPGNTQTGP